MIRKWLELLKNHEKEFLKCSYIENEIQYTSNSHVVFAMNKGNYFDIEEKQDKDDVVMKIKRAFPEKEHGKENEISFNLIEKYKCPFTEKMPYDEVRNPYVYKFYDNDFFTVTVNAEYVKMVVDILGENCKAYAIISTLPVLFESEKGKAFIYTIIKS